MAFPRLASLLGLAVIFAQLLVGLEGVDALTPQHSLAFGWLARDQSQTPGTIKVDRLVPTPQQNGASRLASIAVPAPSPLQMQVVFDAVRDFLAGGIAGGLASTIVFPIDLAKSRIQNQVIVPGQEILYTNVIQTIGKVASQEGILGLYKGVAPVLLGALPEGALEIGTNNFVREQLAKFRGTSPSSLSLSDEVFAGSCAGFAQILVTSPMERVKILQQVMGAKAGSVMDIVRQQGVRGLYKGSRSCWLRDIPFAALYFSIYAQTRKALQDFRVSRGEAKDNVLDDLVAGLVAGVPAAGLTTPFDVIKTRLQAMDAPAAGAARVGIRTTVSQLWKEAGVAGFFKGFNGRVGRIAPQMAICLALFEALKNL
mmetsp:Transcript_9993/g.15634  ORF Transcript_9993/g.15634 Transcript_9993/m.15634 type:complete len:370 (-) Transcript_9993:449-1558(-)|eukprot:CAMPEP_0184321090 /NCGR_PEP_ID=MMETSP1049-20130417/117294_1 /TAXON_ID=77928 /ORGANISM="Proteomonas sulcata, Strain CCMP704" /LENGTH=369 /DNA_ID=CAMNT_0026641781 /DNA_START=156 /DNA_END=1265 /DNA_ORIENTATION=-